MKLKFIPLIPVLMFVLFSSGARSRTCHYTCTPPTCYPYDDPSTWNDTTNNPDNIPPGMNPDGSFLVDSATAERFGTLHPEAWDYNPSTPRSEKTYRALDAARVVLSENVSEIVRLPGFARTYVSLDGRLGPDGSPLPVVFVGIDDRRNSNIRTTAAEQAPKTVKGIPVSLQFYSEFKPIEGTSKDPSDRDGATDPQDCTPPSDAELYPDDALYDADDRAAQAVLAANLSEIQAIPGYSQWHTRLDAKGRIGPDGLTITIIVVFIDDLEGPDNCAYPTDVARHLAVRCNKAIRKAALAAAPASLGGIPLELEFYSDIRLL